MLLDISDALEELEEEITLTRREAGSRDNNGNWIDGATTVTTPLAVVQSLSGQEKLNVPEAVRDKETIKFHSQYTDFQAADEKKQVVSDKIGARGETWEVIQVFNRENLGGYWKAIAIKQ